MVLNWRKEKIANERIAKTNGEKEIADRKNVEEQNGEPRKCRNSLLQT